MSTDEKVVGFPYEEWERLDGTDELLFAVDSARNALGNLHPVHFPIAFPEVFLRSRPGFDVIIGNPPWQEATVEEHAFWARHFPGLRGLPQKDQESEKVRLRDERPDLVQTYGTELAEMDGVRKALVGGAYPGMGIGDPDLYKAFCWRFWHLTATDGGRIGVVLPRSALAAKGSTAFRRAMFDVSAEINVTILLNNRQWVFSKVHPQYSIGLVCISHGAPAERSIRLQGPYSSLAAFATGVIEDPAEFRTEEVLTWNDSASLPLLPSGHSVEVFRQLHRSPRLDLNVERQWRARPDTEMHATAQKPLMDLNSEHCPDGFWPVYKGESFDLWKSDTGTYYAFAEPGPALEWIQNKRLHASQRRRDTPHGEFPLAYLRDESTLPCFAPRIAFRDVTNRTNQPTHDHRVPCSTRDIHRQPSTLPSLAAWRRPRCRIPTRCSFVDSPRLVCQTLRRDSRQLLHLQPISRTTSRP